MSYVDIGWPLGLTIVGVEVILIGQGWIVRKALIGGAYLLIGGRMSLMAIAAWRLGHFNRELPRHRYQRRRWQARNFRERPAMLFEVAIQGLANASILATPAIIASQGGLPYFALVEILALVIFFAAFTFESVADAQKIIFNAQAREKGLKGAHCNVGLWRYCRHPNYFGEWNVWNALALFTLPSLWALAPTTGLGLAAVLGGSLLFVSYFMYQVLTKYSGAVPSEYYSVNKRPGYAKYQLETNMFFPGPKKIAD